MSETEPKLKAKLKAKTKTNAKAKAKAATETTEAVEQVEEAITTTAAEETKDTVTTEETAATEEQTEPSVPKEGNEAEAEAEAQAGAQAEVEVEGKKERERFSNFLLDKRLLHSLVAPSVRLLLRTPTTVQSRAIPLGLQGRDLLLKAPTGSGKTAAYALPILQRILSLKEAIDPETVVHGTRALILVPTRELCFQVKDYLKRLSHFCKEFIRVANLSPDASVAAQKAVLSEQPDILISTPSQLLVHLGQTVSLQETLEILVIDEADLVLSYGYEEDIRKILLSMPKSYQAYITSATLSEDIENLKRLVLRNPEVILVDEEPVNEKPRITQYFLNCSEEDKYTYIFTLLQLNLVEKKVVIFVNSMNTAFKLKLFFERFFIKAVMLNSELPFNSRQHILQLFNRGLYDYLIATDEKATSQIESSLPRDEYQSERNTLVEEHGSGKRKKLKAKVVHKDSEYGVSRGFDFKDVRTVINFDFPADTVDNYVHRVGRTARGRMTGTSISFVTQEDGPLLNSVIDYFESKDEPRLKAFNLTPDKVNSFRYRCEDVLHSITRNAIREARLREIKTEVANSEKLKTHFRENPSDLAALRHDGPLIPRELDPSLKIIPSYIKTNISVGEQRQLPASVKRHIAKDRNSRQPQKKSKSDPLQGFEFKPKTK